MDAYIAAGMQSAYSTAPANKVVALNNYSKYSGCFWRLGTLYGLNSFYDIQLFMFSYPYY